MDKKKTLYTLAQHITLLGIVGLGLALAPGQLSAMAADGLLHNIRFDANSRHFVIDTTGPVKAIVNTLTIAGRKRVIIDLDNADIAGDLPRDTQLLEDLTAQLPGLKNVTVNQYGGNGRPIVRVLLDLQGDPGAIRILQNQGPHIELELSDYAAPSATSNYGNPSTQTTTPRTTWSNSGDDNNSPPTGQQNNVRPTVQYPTPSRNTAQTSTNSTISRDLYNQSLQTQQELRQQIDALQRQVASQSSNAPSAAQMEQMKRTLVNMNIRYEQLEQENKSLKSRAVSTPSSNNAGELSRLQSQVESLNTRNSDLNSQIQSLSSRNSEMQTRLTQALNATPAPRTDNMKHNMSELSRQYEQLKQDKLLQGQQLEQMKQDRLAQSQQIQQLMQDKNALSQQITQLKLQPPGKVLTASATQTHTVSDSELQDLRKQLSTAQQAMSDSLKTIKEQNQEMAYLRNQVNTVKSGMDDAAKEQIASLQNANELKDKTIRDLRLQVTNSQATTTANSSATTQLAALKSQLENANHQHQTETQELKRQLQEKSGQLETLNQQFEAFNARQNAQPAASLLQQRDTRISELEKALYVANQKITEGQTAQRELASAKGQILQLKVNEEQREDTQRELGLAKAQIVQLQDKLKEYNTMQGSLSAAKAQITQLQATQAQLKAEAEYAKSRNGQKEALAKLTQQNKQLSQQLQQTTAQLATAQAAQKATQQATSTNTNPDTSAQVSQLQRQVSELSQQLQQTNAQLATAQVAAKQPASTRGNAGNTAQSIQLQKQVSDLSQQLSSMRRENDDLKNSLASKATARSSNPDAEASYQEAKIALKAKKTADALDKFKAALLLDPSNSRYTLDYSVALSDDQQYAEAIDVLRRYLQQNPSDREAYNQLGKTYLLNDQADAANQSFIRAIPVSTINNYATSLKKLGRMADAENMFKLALSVNPKDSEVLFNLGNLYNNQNKLELARNKYLEAIQIRPDFAEAHYNLGLIFSKLGDNPKAIVHLEKFLQLSPNARNAETIRAYVQKLKA